MACELCCARGWSVWVCLVVAALIPGLARADTVEIGYLYVTSECEPAPRSPARRVLCTGTVEVLNETLNSDLYDLTFVVGGVPNHNSPPLLIPGGYEYNVALDYATNTNWDSLLEPDTVLSVQAEFINHFTSTFYTANLGGPDAIDPAVYNLPGGAFTVDVESPQFTADFQGELPILIEADPVTAATTASEPSSLLLLLGVGVGLLCCGRARFLPTGFAEESKLSDSRSTPLFKTVDNCPDAVKAPARIS